MQGPGTYHRYATPTDSEFYPWLVDPIPLGEGEPELRCSECHILATVIYLGEGYCSRHARIWVDRAPIYIARTKGLMA